MKNLEGLMSIDVKSVSNILIKSGLVIWDDTAIFVNSYQFIEPHFYYS